MPWTCDPDFADTLDTDLSKEGWVYVTVADRSDTVGRGEVQIGRYPGADEVTDDTPEERKERVVAWLQGRLNERLGLADKRGNVKLRIRGWGGKGVTLVFTRTFTARFDGEVDPVEKDVSPLASEARELVNVILNGMRGVVGTASSLMAQMGSQLIDERRQTAELQQRVANANGADDDRKARTAVASRFLDTLDGAVKAVTADVNPVLANPKVRALLERPEVREALKDETSLDEMLQAVSFMAQNRQAVLKPRSQVPVPPESAAVRSLEAELAKDRNLAILLNTPEGTDALLTTLRHLADDLKENDDEPVPS